MPLVTIPGLPITAEYGSPKSKLLFILGMSEVFAMISFYLGGFIAYLSYAYWGWNMVGSALLFAMGCAMARYIGQGQKSEFTPERTGHPLSMYSDEKRPVAIVTGASSGIGRSTTVSLIRLGTTVVMAVRDIKKGERVKKEIAKELNLDDAAANTLIKVLHCDLDVLDSVVAFTNAFRALKLPLTILINNAGAMVTSYKRITDVTPNVGSAFTTNVLGHFLLTALLLDLIIAHKSRIVNVSSAITVSVPDSVTVQDCFMVDEKTWDAPTAYGRTKMCNIWFNHALQKRLDRIQVEKGILTPHSYSQQTIQHAVTTVVHPGTVWSPFHMPYYKNTFGGLLLWFPVIMMPMAFFAMKNLEEGARTTVHCAVGRNPIYHQYLSDEKQTQASHMFVHGPQPGQFHCECRVGAVPPLGFNDDKSEELWKVAVELLKPYLSKCAHKEWLQ